MNAVVIEHVPVSELPEPWRARLAVSETTRVTIRIEEETSEIAENPLFGMWRDREDLTDVDAYIDQCRAPRY